MSAVLSILQHALGVDRYGQGNQYRCHFVAGPGHSDYETCLLATRDGLMIHKGNQHIVGGHIFYVTDKGREFVRDNSPAAPKQSASQKRYQRYLDHDSGLRFGDWLKSYGSMEPAE